jgi:hypothetical protein
MCYEKPDSVHWESHFVDGFRTESLGSLPGNWETWSLVMNMLSAAASLASEFTQERFVPELKRLVHAGLCAERIG